MNEKNIYLKKFYSDHKLPLKNDRNSYYDISCQNYFYEYNKYCPQ